MANIVLKVKRRISDILVDVWVWLNPATQLFVNVKFVDKIAQLNGDDNFSGCIFTDSWNPRKSIKREVDNLTKI